MNIVNHTDTKIRYATSPMQAGVAPSGTINARGSARLPYSSGGSYSVALWPDPGVDGVFELKNVDANATVTIEITVK